MVVFPWFAPCHYRVQINVTNQPQLVRPQIWLSGTHHAELYSLLLPTFCLLLVTFHLVLEVFARQLLLSVTVSPLTSVPAKLSLFPLSFTHCLVTHLGSSDSFSTMALYKSTYLLTYLLTKVVFFHLFAFSCIAEFIGWKTALIWLVVLFSAEFLNLEKFL